MCGQSCTGRSVWTKKCTDKALYMKRDAANAASKGSHDVQSSKSSMEQSNTLASA